MFNSAELIAAILGAMRIGAIPTLANVLLPASDLATVARDARASVAIVTERIVEQGFKELAPDIRTTLIAGDETLTTSSDDGEPYSTVEDSPGFWLCTSGSTGTPKLAMHRHVDIRHSFETYARGVLDVTQDDRAFSIAPISHAYGLGASITFPLGAGGVSIVDPSFPTPPPRTAEV